MKLSKEEGCSIVYEDHENWKLVEKKVIDTSRWSVTYEGIFQHLPTERYYCMDWSVGATEQQYERPFEYCEPKPYEVHKVEKMVEVWEPIG